MMKQQRVFPECNVDTNFVGHLIGVEAMHKSSCNEVVKAVNLSDQFAIGIIDADKRMPTMDEGFVRFDQSKESDGENKHVSMYIHNDGKRYMFTVKPAMDKFILDAANQQNVDMKAAGYSSTLEGFKKETKRITASNDPKLRKLFDLIKNNPEVKCFKNTLKYLIAFQYNADIETAKNFFDGSLDENALYELMSKSFEQ